MRRKRGRDGPPQALVEDGLPVVLGREVERAHRDGRSLSLVVLELDHLEQFTATHNRSARNSVLRQMAELVRARSREIDVVRLHGDELVCILPGLAPGGLTSFSLAVHEAIEQHRFEPGGLHFTASLGAAELGPDFTDANELLHAAEGRLSFAKSNLGSVCVRRPQDECVAVLRSEDLERNACLVVVYGHELGRRHDIERREMTIGRVATSDIQVSDDSVSRTHATITADDIGVRICDKGSKRGTLVNGVVIHDARLDNGDIVIVGRHSFKLLMGANIESMYHEELYRLSTIDGLTQLFNKRYFTDTLERELSRAHRYDRPLALVMLDIDCFKRCNDTFGERTGDYVLQSIARLACDRTRKADVVARYGGDELAVTLPECDLPAAAAFAETLREAVAQARFEFEGRLIPLTISLGVAVVAPDVAKADDLVRLAEARLARAKALDRNRVVSSDEQA